MGKANASLTLDQESRAMMYEGCTFTQLTALFKMDDATLRARMHGVAPCGVRGHAAIYDVAEVARRCGNLTDEQVDAAMKRLNHNDLPKMLTKEYWNGLRAKQAYLKEEGDLWETAKVVEAMGDVAKTLKMELDLLIDAVERRYEISEDVRNTIVMLIDGAKDNMVHKINEKFSSKKSGAPTPPIEDDDDEL